MEHPVNGDGVMLKSQSGLDMLGQRQAAEPADWLIALLVLKVDKGPSRYCTI